MKKDLTKIIRTKTMRPVGKAYTNYDQRGILNALKLQ